MRFSNLNSVSKAVTLTACLLVALAGCGGDDKKDDGGGAGTAVAGTGAAGTGAAGMAMAGTGAAGTGAGGTMAPVGGTGAAGTGAAGTGAAGTGASGTGASGTGAAGTGSASSCDTSTFLDCHQGGQYWGTEQQFGPCGSGSTVYGVTAELGSYGASSEYNVGADFNTGNTVADFLICPVFIDSFGADPVGSADLKDTHDLDFGLFTVFYPSCMPEGEKFPLITWGNGTCAMPEGYGPLLRWVASHGYIIVAPNSVQVGMGTQQVKGIDFMLAANEDPNSKYFGKIDTDKIGAMGHSQGGMGTVVASADPRIKSVILWNGGTSAGKPFLAVSGDADIGSTTAAMDNAVQAAAMPAAWLWYHQIPTSVNGSTTGPLAPGHLTLMMESERVQDVAVAWWDHILKNKPEAATFLRCPGGMLCDGTAYPSMWAQSAGVVAGSTLDSSIEYGHNGML